MILLLNTINTIYNTMCMFSLCCNCFAILTFTQSVQFLFFLRFLSNLNTLFLFNFPFAHLIFNLKCIHCEICVPQFYTFKCCIGFGRGITPATQTSPVRRTNSPDHPNPALAITELPSSTIARIGWALRVLLLTDSSSCLKDRKVRKKCR